MNGSFNPGSAEGRAFRFTMAEGSADRIRLDCESGFHTSRCDASNHYTFRNAGEQITGHAYGNGAFKSAQGFPGPIGMF